MAAGISANLAGIRKECIREALGDFKGVEHRLEKSLPGKRVDYINDQGYQCEFLLVCFAKHENQNHPDIRRERQRQRL